LCLFIVLIISRWFPSHRILSRDGRAMEEPAERLRAGLACGAIAPVSFGSHLAMLESRERSADALWFG
jgi:hypothetical protein